MNVYDKVAASVPVNRQAAHGIGGSRTESPLTARQQRENLLSRLAKLESDIREARSPARKKELGILKLEAQNAIRALKTIHKPVPSYVSHFEQVAREMIAPAMFKIIRQEAMKRADAGESPLKPETEA